MKKLLLLLVTLFTGTLINAQSIPVHPTFTGTGKFIGISKPLRDIPAMSQDQFNAMKAKAHLKQLNEKLKYRNYPYASTALPQGPDAAWQKEMGKTPVVNSNPIMNFNGATSPYYPPDCNGTAGPNHFMQTINCVYSIYDKNGNLVAGPTNMNQLFGNVPGANDNDGDPIILYDEQADRWLATEFSITGSPNYMLMAVSTTNDPTGTWYQYSFQVASMPDYPKFGIWRDGYYMGDNNSSSNDIYVFEREKMLIGATAQAVGFNNPYRPSSVDGFMCVPPVDNDGQFAPAGSPGLYIAFNDDAFGGGTDQLWIYELDVDWTSTSSSTFNRVQQLDVVPFDCNFGNNWNNIPQKGTSQKVDAIPQVIMNVPQYRNFGSYQTLVCCHTVDVDGNNHAGIRWYELRKAGSQWTVRQTGTYAPDALNRWMGSILLNSYNNIGLGYSVSSADEYPGIRFCGQSPTAYNAGAGVLDIAEDTIWVGTNSQTGANRWGDYAQVSVDPADGKTFWFTTEYIGSGGSRNTRIASFKFQTNPTAYTLAATQITGSTAQLNASINPQGIETEYYFKYGTNGFDLTDSTEVMTAGSGTDSVLVSANISGLLVNKKYYFRVIATYPGGSTTGVKLNFTTLNEPAFLTVTPPEQHADLMAGTTGYSVGSNTSWTVTHTADWSTPDTTAGSGNDSIHMAFTENTTPYTRTDTITVSSVAGSSSVLLIQHGIPAILDVTPPVQNVALSAGTTEFAVTSNIAWTASSDAAWCTVTPSGDGNGTITATFEANNLIGSRTATISVSGQAIGPVWVTVVQDGLAPALAVTPLEQNVPATPGNTSFNVTSNTAWTVTSNAPWCTPTAGGTGNGTIVADYTANSSSEPRTAMLEVTAAGVPVVQLLVNQARSAIGIEEHASADFTIYPNPTRGTVTFIPGTSDISEISLVIHDGNGKQVFSESFSEKKSHRIDLNGLADGIYHVTVKSGDRTTKSRLVIKRS